MILADTTVWVDHLRRSDARLAALLDARQVFIHPFVVGELALGQIPQRDVILGALQRLPRTETATDQEVLSFVEQHRLFGRGIGYVDAHLVASTRLTPEAFLWTRDRRLFEVANSLGLAANF